MIALTLWIWAAVTSKWAGEQLVRRAVAAGLPVSVFRPGMITGSAATGYGSPTQFVGRLIRGLAALQCCPVEDVAVDMLPVDYAAWAIVALSRRRLPPGSTFHVANGRHVAYTELGAACRASGHRVDPVPYAQWRAKLYASGETTPLAPLLWIFGEQCNTFRSHVDCTRFVAALASLGFPPAVTQPPAIDAALLRRYVEQQLLLGDDDA